MKLVEKKNGTFLLQETESIGMDFDQIELLEKGTGRPQGLTKLSSRAMMWLGVKKPSFFTEVNLQKVKKPIGSCMSIEFLILILPKGM